MKYVLDSSAWYAYSINDDVSYSKALEVVKQNHDFVVPYPVIEELAALLHHRRGKNTVITSVYNPFFTSTKFTIEYISPRIDQEIWTMYKNCPNKIDYVDASVYYFAKKLKLPIFTFDRHFNDLRPRPHLIPR